MQHSYIDINGKPFYYDAIELTEASAAVITIEEAKNLLFSTKDILDGLDIKFFLTFGTLLGAIREHSFISHDYDIDIMTFEKEKLLNAIPQMYEKGLKLCRVTEDRLYSFMINGFYIDIYIIQDAPFPFGKWCYMIGSYTIWKKYLKETEIIDFLGHSFEVPRNPHKILKFWYGKRWQTPIPGYHGRGDVYPIYFYRKYLKKYIKRS